MAKEMTTVLYPRNEIFSYIDINSRELFQSLSLRWILQVLH